MVNLRGVGVALVTPFKECGAVDFEALERLVNHVINGGVDFLVVLGTTGEPVTLSSQERKDVLNTVLRINDGKLPVVLGMGSNNTQTLIEDIKATDLSQISALLSVTPYYNRPSQEGLYQHYMAVAEASPIPVILYNVPSRTGVNLSADTVLRLANASKNIIAVKEASGCLSQVSKIIKDAPEDFFVISGDDNLTLPIIALGGDGIISVAANVFPYDFTEMVKGALDENLVISRSKYYKLFAATELLFEQGNPAGIKCALEVKGIAKRYVRLPLSAANDSLAERIAAEVEKYKL